MLHPALLEKKPTSCRTIHLVADETYAKALKKLSAMGRAYLAACGFTPKPGKLALVPDASGAIADVVLGIDASEGADPFAFGKLPVALPDGAYSFAEAPKKPDLATLAFALATYRFTKYKTGEAPKAKLVVPRGVDAGRISRIATAIAMGRDLINTPANDLGPEELARQATLVAQRHGADVKEIIGKRLLKKNFPLIYAVGRAAAEEPRLISFTWGNPAHPRVTLVGKGVTFDTGGLDLKPSAAMLLMKKDMGGAATALAAADMIMGQNVPVRLTVYLPIVENAVAGPAFRPGDVLTSRKGLTVEIGNTDAEGRLILADALTKAADSEPDLLIDFATLTGAARVALGQDLPPFFTNDDALAADIAACGDAIYDPVWRLPLWQPYQAMIDSKIADVNNSGAANGFAGAITAALFLQRFVTKTKSYAHFDMYGWTMTARNGMPDGGNPQVARLVLALVEKRFG